MTETNETMNDEDLSSLESEIKLLRHKKALLLQEKETRENERRKKLVAELKELKKSVEMLEKSTDGQKGTNCLICLNQFFAFYFDNVNQLTAKAFTLIKRALYIAPPILLYLIGCFTVMTHQDLLSVFITAYVYAVVCYLEYRINSEMRTPFCMLMLISAFITTVPSVPTDSFLWQHMANSHAKITITIAICLVIVCLVYLVIESGTDFLKSLGYVAMYGLLVGVMCELYWGHQDMDLVWRNIVILIIYNVSWYCIERRFHGHFSFSFMTRACVVYAIVCVYPYPDIIAKIQLDKQKNSRVTHYKYQQHQYSKQTNLLELNHDQNVAELILCLEFIRPIFCMIPITIFDHFNKAGKYRIRLIHILVYSAAVMLMSDTVPRKWKELLVVSFVAPVLYSFLIFLSLQDKIFSMSQPELLGADLLKTSYLFSRYWYTVEFSRTILNILILVMQRFGLTVKKLLNGLRVEKTKAQ